MNKDRIKKLLARFFDGTSTREEENILIYYFTHEENIPEEWKIEQLIFRQLEETRHEQVSIPDGLEERLSKLIDKQEIKERQIYPISPDNKKKRSVSLHYRWIIGTAACILLFSSIGVKMTQSTEKEALTPERAYAETEQALYLFARTLKIGVGQITTAQQTTIQIQENINKTLNLIKQ